MVKDNISGLDDYVFDGVRAVVGRRPPVCTVRCRGTQHVKEG